MWKHLNMSFVKRKPVFWGFDQVRLKPACEATGLEISAIASRGNILSRQQTTKVLIRLHGCAGWSVPLLFAYRKNSFSHDVAHIEMFPHFQKMTQIGVSIIVSIPHCPTVWNTNDDKIYRDASTLSKNRQNQEMWIRFYIEMFPHFQKWPKSEYLTSLVFHTILLAKPWLQRDVFYMFKDFFSHTVQTAKIGVSIIISIPHCHTDKVWVVKMVNIGVSIIISIPHCYTDKVWVVKMVNIGVSIIISIPHCHIDRVWVVKMVNIGVSITISIPHCHTDKVWLLKWSISEYLSSLIFHTVILTKCELLKWSILEYLSSLIFHTVLLTKCGC